MADTTNQTDSSDTGMSLFKRLLRCEREGKTMTSEEREWFEVQKKQSLKYGNVVQGYIQNPDANCGSER